MAHIAAQQVAMVDEALHRYAAFASAIGTLRITARAVFTGRNVAPFLERPAIVPDVKAPTI